MHNPRERSLSSRPGRRRRAWAVAAVAAAVLAGLEIGLRLLGMTQPILYAERADVGYEPRPDQRSVRLGVPIHANDLGLRDDEDCADLAGAPVVLVLGDSVTYGGSRIRQPDLFTELLETRLRRVHPEVKVLNGGVNGYSVTQMLNRAERLVPRLRPAALVFYVIEGDFLRPPVRLLSERNLIFPRARPKVALAAALRRSVLLLDRRYGFLPAALRSRLRPPMFIVPPYDADAVVDTHLRGIAAFAARCAGEGWLPPSRILFVLAPTRAQVAQGGPGSGNTRELLDRIAAAGVHARDAGPLFRGVIDREGLAPDALFWDIVHYRKKGHRVAADVLGELVLDELCAAPRTG